MLLQKGGAYNGKQLLSAAMIKDALYRSNVMTGLATGRTNRFGEERYSMAFWSIPYRTKEGCRFQIPYMSGFGGNLVILLPNGVSAFRFADGLNYGKEAMILAGEAVRPFCAPTSHITEMTAPRAPLGANEVRTELSGNTFLVGPNSLYLAPDGIAYALSRKEPTEVDVGWWHVNENGQYCRRWNVSDGARSRCFVVYRNREIFELEAVDQWTSFVFRRIRGKSEGF
jgi:hypothetical protein